MIESKFRTVVLAVMLAVPTTGAFLVSGLAYGQQLEEIIVTARKKEESIQDVPMAVTAITEQLRESSVRRIEDIQDSGCDLHSISRDGRQFAFYPRNLWCP